MHNTVNVKQKMPLNELQFCPTFFGCGDLKGSSIRMTVASFWVIPVNLTLITGDNLQHEGQSSMTDVDLMFFLLSKWGTILTEMYRIYNSDVRIAYTDQQHQQRHFLSSNDPCPQADEFSPYFRE